MDSIKKFKDHTLQKATTDFGGRSWTAWFDKDVTYEEGPYKFNQLPGLIFEIYDSEKNYHFTLEKSYILKTPVKTSAFLETFYGQSALRITEKMLNQKKTEFYENPLKGEDIKDPEVYEEKKMIQSYLQNNNNPIEINKVIDYSKK